MARNPVQSQEVATFTALGHASNHCTFYTKALSPGLVPDPLDYRARGPVLVSEPCLLGMFRSPIVCETTTDKFRGTGMLVRTCTYM